MKQATGKAGLSCLAISIVLTGCLSDDQNLKLQAEKHVSSMLKDPGSARFGELYLVRAGIKENLQQVVVCGVVDGTNSFGAYGGGERFVAYGYKGKVGGSKLLGISRAYLEGADRRPSVGTMDSTNKATIFEEIHWNVSCVDAAHPPTYSATDQS